jgi:hypothetical protein
MELSLLFSNQNLCCAQASSEKNMKEILQKEKSSKREKSPNAGMVRVVLCRSSDWSSLGAKSLQTWTDPFYDFSKPLEMMLSASIAEGQYDGDFFIISDKPKSF